MKKLVSILIILLILCSCSSISQDEAINKLNLVFDNYDSINSHRANNNTKYYSFYLPSDIQEIEYDDTYHHFVFNLSDFIMNLNVNYILCENVFSIEPDDPFAYLNEYTVFSKNNLSNGGTSPYKFCLYLVDNQYYFSFYTNKLSFSGKTYLNEIKDLLEHMIMIDRSAELYYDVIVNDYYSGATIEHTIQEEKHDNAPTQKDGIIEDILDPELKSKLQEKQEQTSENAEDSK